MDALARNDRPELLQVIRNYDFREARGGDEGGNCTHKNSRKTLLKVRRM